MAVVNKESVFRTANRMQLEIHHFAKGTYPVAGREFHALPVNRFFLPISNPGGANCRIEDEKNSFVLTPGKAYFAPLHYPCRFALDRDLEFVSIHFTLELYEGIDIFSDFNSLCEIPSPEYLERALKIFDLTEPFTAALALRGIVSDFAADLGGIAESRHLSLVTRFAPFKKELDYLQSRPPARVTVEELANLRKVTRECFSRNFVKAAGITPKLFLTRMTLSRACRLLAGTTRPIKEVAQELGFANEFYFSRFFRKHMNIPPGKYRHLSAGKWL